MQSVNKSILKKIIIIVLALIFSIVFLYVYENFFSEKDMFRNKGEDLFVVMDEGISEATNLSAEIEKNIKKAGADSDTDPLMKLITSKETSDAIKNINDNKSKVDSGISEMKEIKFDFNKYQIQRNNYYTLYEAYNNIVSYPETLVDKLSEGESPDKISLENDRLVEEYNNIYEVVKNDLHYMGGEHRFSLRYLLVAFIPACFLIFKKKEDSEEGDNWHDLQRDEQGRKKGNA